MTVGATSCGVSLLPALPRCAEGNSNWSAGMSRNGHGFGWNDPTYQLFDLTLTSDGAGARALSIDVVEEADEAERGGDEWGGWW